jgi:hypothetical protein
MVESAELERFRSSTAELSRMVKEALEAFFLSLNLAKPEAVRDALLEFVPLLVEQYGAIAATLAAEWYEDLRLSSGASGAFRAVTVPSGIPLAAVEAKVRYLAGHLWTPEPERMLAPLLTATDKYVKQSGRDAIQWNADREGARWARVPSGPKTCSWCLILASRDAVYISERSAFLREDGETYHGACDCIAVRIGSDEDYPENYLPAEYYEMYQAARDDSGSGKMDEIAASMRKLFPEYVTDGSHSH